MPRPTANSQKAGYPTDVEIIVTPPVNSVSDNHFDMAHVEEISTLDTTASENGNGHGPPAPPTQTNTPRPSPEPPTPDLAHALMKLADSLSGPKNSGPPSHLRSPDPFDGSDSWKLQAFIVQCTLTFHDRPAAFPNDSAKVTYALSYLKGTALDWFEPGLMALDEPRWLNSYSAFLSELKLNFGPHDPEGEAEAELENLRMRDGARITGYMVNFNRLAARIQWGSSALKRQFYNGLLSRIKDEIARVGKPDNIHDLKTLCHSIDARHWERKAEVARENKSQDRSNDNKGKSSNSGSNSGGSGNNNSGNSSSNHKGDSKKSSNSNNSGKAGNSNSGSSSSNSGPSNNNSGSLTKTSDLSSKLGKDGKLTQQERQRRFEQNLCMFCGKSGHVAKDCHKATAAKARSANTDNKSADKTSDGKSSESKNQ